LPAQAQHWPLIDTDRFYPSGAKPKKLCILLLNLNLPDRTFYEASRIFARKKAKIHCSYLYHISHLAVKENLMSYEYFFNAIKQNLKLEQNPSRSDSGDPPMAGPERSRRFYNE
jgi:hypothetical protein